MGQKETSHRRIVRCKFDAKLGQIESSVDLPHKVIFGDRVAKTKLVEQLTLVTLQTARSWIDLAKIRVSTTELRFAARPFLGKSGNHRDIVNLPKENS